MAMFLVVRLRSGPHRDASLPLEKQSDWPTHAPFVDELVGTGFALRTASVEPWTIRLDGRRA